MGLNDPRPVSPPVMIPRLCHLLRMAAAIKLFEMGQLSSGAAARLAGVPRTVFLFRLADYGVDTFNLTAEDLNRETRLA